MPVLKKKVRLTDGELMLLISQRQRPGAEALYDTYGKFLHLAISRIIPEKALAEKVLQEVLIKIWNTIDDYVLEKERIYTWMITIARQKAFEAETCLAKHDEKEIEGAYAGKT